MEQERGEAYAAGDHRAGPAREKRVPGPGAIDAALRRCSGGVYRLRLIHGYHGGTALRDLCREYAGHPRVLRLVASSGSTDLVLREF